VFRRFFDPSTNRWFRVFDRIRIGEPGRFQIFGEKNRIVKLPGMSTSKPSKNLRVSGKNLWFFPGYLQALFLFNFAAESELGPSRSVHRPRAYMLGLTSSKEPVENQRTAQHWFKSS
jgi:hypothetical protein